MVLREHGDRDYQDVRTGKVYGIGDPLPRGAVVRD